MNNDLTRARRWYTLLASILLVAFIGYYAATGNTVPRYEHFFRDHPSMMKSLMLGDLARFWTVFTAPLMIVGGALLMRQANGGARGYTEGALLGLAAICAATGAVMLPFGVKAGLAFWVFASLVGGAMLATIAGFRFVFNKATWRRLGDWLGGKDIEETQKNGGNQPPMNEENHGALHGGTAW